MATGLGHGLGEIFTALAARLPVGDIGSSRTFFHLSQSMPYDFGANSRLLSETDRSFNTGSMRVTVLRDLLGVTGPKYGRGINVCKACTSHLDSRAVNPCAVPVGDLRPMRQAWLDRDVAHCGYCRPGQIMAAVALVRRVAEEGRALTDADLDGIGSICRRGTYLRIREAIREGAGNT